MESETHHHTFGSYLKSFRLEKDQSIQAIAYKTKIAVHLIHAMEDNSRDQLPPQPYVKSFIRTYAKTVGADANVAVCLYIDDLRQRESTKKQALRRRAKLDVLRRILIVIGIFTGVVLLVKSTNFFPVGKPLPSDTAGERTEQPEPVITRDETKDFRLAAQQQQETLKLQVTAVEKTWLKVIVDGQNTRSYDLKPEDRLELEGTDNFNVMIGNATGLQISLNGRPVQIYGSKGQVVSLQLP